MSITCVSCCITANGITAFSTFILAIATVVIGIAAYLQYRKNSDIKRTEFLISLYQKFYENKGDLKETREWIDSTPIANQEEFDRKKVADKTFEEKFTDYLNFFQLIVVLKNSEQIREREITQMFHYYLKLIKNNEFIMKYLSDNDYKELKTFLLEYKDAK